MLRQNKLFIRIVCLFSVFVFCVAEIGYGNFSRELPIDNQCLSSLYQTNQLKKEMVASMADGEREAIARDIISLVKENQEIKRKSDEAESILASDLDPSYPRMPLVDYSSINRGRMPDFSEQHLLSYLENRASLYGLDLQDFFNYLRTFGEDSTARAELNQIAKALNRALGLQLPNNYPFQETAIKHLEQLIEKMVSTKIRDKNRTIRIKTLGDSRGSEAIFLAKMIFNAIQKSQEPDLDQWNISIIVYDVSLDLLAEARQNLDQLDNPYFKEWVSFDYGDFSDDSQWPRILSQNPDIITLRNISDLGILDQFIPPEEAPGLSFSKREDWIARFPKAILKSGNPGGFFIVNQYQQKEMFLPFQQNTLELNILRSA